MHSIIKLDIPEELGTVQPQPEALHVVEALGEECLDLPWTQVEGDLCDEEGSLLLSNEGFVNHSSLQHLEEVLHWAKFGRIGGSE